MLTPKKGPRAHMIHLKYANLESKSFKIQGEKATTKQ